MKTARNQSAIFPLEIHKLERKWICGEICMPISWKDIVLKKKKKRTKLSLINLLLGWNKWLYLHFGIIPFCFSVHFYNSASILSGVFRIFTLLSFVSKQKWINAIIVALYISLNYCFAEPTWNIKSVFVVVLTDDLRFYDLAGDQQLP